MDFSNPDFSLAMLKSIHKTRCEKFLDIENDSAKKAEAAILKTNCEDLLAEIGKRERATKPSVQDFNPMNSPDYKPMVNYFNDIPAFCPTDDVILFVKKLERGFKTHIARLDRVGNE